MSLEINLRLNPDFNWR